jgi:hypothetical protein
VRRLPRQSPKKALLAFETPDIRRGAPSVAHVGQSLWARQFSRSGRDREILAVLLRLYRLLDVYRNAAQSVRYLSGPTEVQHHVVVYRELREVLQRLYRQPWPTMRKRGVYLILSQARYLDQCVTRHGEQTASSCGDHDRV